MGDGGGVETGGWGALIGRTGVGEGHRGQQIKWASALALLQKGWVWRSRWCRGTGRVVVVAVRGTKRHRVTVGHKRELASTIAFMCSLSARQIVAGSLWPLKVGTQWIVRVLVHGCTSMLK